MTRKMHGRLHKFLADQRCILNITDENTWSKIGMLITQS